MKYDTELTEEQEDTTLAIAIVEGKNEGRATSEEIERFLHYLNNLSE